MFGLLDNILVELKTTGAHDVKTFTSILHLLGNWLSLEPESMYA